MGRSKISPQVAAALHRALDVIVDAINTPDTEKPKRRRGPSPLPSLPQKPDAMSQEEWRAHAELEADKTIEAFRHAAATQKRSRALAPYRTFTEKDWSDERARLVRVFASGKRDA
jgi:hypothetical protein